MPESANSFDELPMVQLAAGGVVWQTREPRAKLAMVHRPKYDDWTLPKGKPEPGETLAETAQREVEEEIGLKAQIMDFAGVVHYPIGEHTTKVVLFWHMLAQGESRFQPNREIDAVEWRTVEQAIQKLSYGVEVELLKGLKPL